MSAGVDACSQIPFFDARKGANDLECVGGENTPDWHLSHVQGQPQHRVCSAQKNVDALPPLLQTVLPLEGHHDELVIDELWTFIQSKAQQAWVWLALSRRNLQVVAFYVGRRDLESARALWKQVPSPWKNGLVFTDGLRLYQTLFQDTPLKHCRCIKTDKATFGETSIVEGANNALRQGVSYLGRKTQAFARSLYWLQTRFHWFIHHWNLRQARKYN